MHAHACPPLDTPSIPVIIISNISLLFFYRKIYKSNNTNEYSQSHQQTASLMVTKNATAPSPPINTATTSKNGMYSYSQPKATKELPHTYDPHPTSTAEPLKDDSDWLYFVLPIIVTVLIFMLVIIYICIKKRDDTWHDPLEKERAPESQNKEKTVSFNDGNCKIYVTNDNVSPQSSPQQRDPLPANWYDQRSRQSCPPISKASLQRAAQKEFGAGNENVLINQEPYYTNVDNPLTTNNVNRRNIINNKTNDNNNNNKRVFHSETDLRFLQVAPDATTNTEKFRLSLEQMNVDVSKDRRYASYVILDGNEYKTPKINDNTSKIRKPSGPSRISRGSFIEITLSDLTPNSKRLSDLPPPLEEQTLLNGENRENREQRKSPQNNKNTNGNERLINDNNNNSPSKSHKLNYPVVNGNGIHNGSIQANKRLPPLPDEEPYNNGGLHLSKQQQQHRLLTKSTSEPPRLHHKDIPFLIDENGNKSSYKQRELSPAKTKTKNIPDIYINGEHHNSIDSRLCHDPTDYEASSYEGKPYLQLLHNGENCGR